MSQEGQPRKRLAGLGSPALRKKLNPSAFYHECALTTLIRKERHINTDRTGAENGRFTHKQKRNP